MASLKVAVTAVAVLTPLAPEVGETEMTVGGVVSPAIVVNDQTLSVASGFPATSFTPADPLLTVAV
jgi:hypothetical protein